MIWGHIVWFVVSVVASVALAPKPPKPKPSALTDFDLPTAEDGRPVPVVFGTMRVTGPNVLWYGDLGTVPVKKKSLFSSTTVGYKYYLGIHFALSHGPVDAITRIEIGEKEAWTGSRTSSGTITINQHKLFGGRDREGGIVGNLDVMMGESTQAANTYLASEIAGPMPAFRGITSMVFHASAAELAYSGKTGGYVGTTSYPKPWAFTARRILKGWANDTPWYSAKAAIGTSMNPAHVLYQCLTDAEWGMGEPASTLDDANWRAAADKFYTEGFGLDLLWNQSTSIEEFVQAVLDHVGGLLRLNHSTGLLEIKLIRDDYDPEDLVLFDENDIRAVRRYQRQAWGETVNEITLIHTDATTHKSTSVTVQDLGNIRAQGGRIGEVVNYPGVTSPDIARLCASRELAARSTPLSQCTLEMTRAFWNYVPGDVFRLSWSALGIDDVVFRALKVKGGTLQDSIIEVDCIEDIFGLPTASYVAVTPPGDAPDDPVFDPVDDDSGANVISATTTAPPGSPADGDKYLVPSGATGAWSGHTGELAIWDADDAVWIFQTVLPGTVVTVTDTGGQVQSTGSGTAAVAYTPIQTTGAVAFASDITPSAISADQNDYNPTGLATASTLRLSATGAARTLTGLAGGSDGRVLLVHNVGSLSLTLADESASSSAANRFALSASVTLAADQSTLLQYDSTSSRWRVIGGVGAGGDSPITSAGYELIAETVLSADATDIAVSGLNLDADGPYFVEVSVANATASALTASLYYNADTTDANYDRSLSTDGVGGAGSNAAVFDLDASTTAHGYWEGNLLRGVGGRVSALLRGGRSTSTAATVQHGSHSWVTTATNVTSLTLRSSVASGFKAGSLVRVLRRTVTEADSLMVQASDIVITSNTTFQDTGLSVFLRAGVYWIELFWAVNSNATPKIEVKQVFSGVLSSITWNRINITGTAAVASHETTLFTSSYTTTNEGTQHWAGRLVVTTAGTFKLQTRQTTSSATAVTFYSGSYLKAKKIG